MRELTLTKFLLARIAEDQADAMTGWRWKALPAGEYAHLQSRALAECDAKRRIVTRLKDALDANEKRPSSFEPMLLLGLIEACSHLAAVYADHSDYQSKWAPDA